MKLLLALSVSVLVLLVACGDDDDGPAAEVGGIWEGEYSSIGVVPHTGWFCVELEQDGRELTGVMAIDAAVPIPVGGRVANDTLSFVWNSGSTATGGTPVPVTFESGGTISGTVAGEAITATYTALDGDTGNWTGARSTVESCG